MSIAGIGSQGPGNLTQMLSSLLSRLDTTSKTSDTTDTSTTSQSTSTSVSSDSNLTGRTKPSLSSMILGALIGLQGQSDSQSSSSSSSSSSSTDPVQNLFSAMDSDSDGSVTQSELETYLEQVGGTTEQADSLYSLLNTDDEDGVSKSEMASQAAPPPPPPGGGPGGPGGPPPSDTADSSSTDDVSNQLVSLFDSNGDGTVTQSELTDFVTAHGGTESDATTEFAALDTSNSGSLTSSNFSDAIEKLQNNYQNDPYASVVSLLDVFSKTAGSTVSVSA